MKNHLDSRKLVSQAGGILEVLSAVLTKSFSEGRPADRVIADEMRRNHGKWGSRDRRVISESVFAVLRWYGVLNGEGISGPEAMVCRAWELENAFDPAVSIPEAVENLAARMKWKPGRRLSFAEIVRDSLPEWVQEELPADTDTGEYVRWLLRRPPVWMRAASGGADELAKILAEEGIEATPGPLPHSISTRPSGVNLYGTAAFRRGLFEIQDLASQAIGAVAAPRSGERWWDPCAGAGGKTLLLADAMERRGTVIASDVRSWKLEDLRKRARRGGFPNIETRDFETVLRRSGRRSGFDGVLVDAPCSCSGVWRRNPDGRWTLNRGEVDELTVIQREILERVSGTVKPGGALVYATCSVFPRENEAAVADFLSGHPEFRLEEFRHPLTGEECSGMARFAPGQGDCDWMFAARMRREK